ncbi:acyltransferase family protein [Escherichia coli]|uniref:acyltransferase family protein n=1 Tax=Escherichia coli TaxID=562 RepID=UPI000907AF6F|nr:acyltransferase [Escherichia coli]EFI1504425.1 acyltransferase [Escherichia coli]EJD3838709.1 acyltransferase [Escherichia coli]EMC8285393.1 acyltransferase [Escherichia coli]MCK2374070.1 acyltransferase [Escherichia coli]MCO7744924.1 acyltransferase [Escherichia coli]
MGYFRFALCIAVAANHLWFIGAIGRYAVFSFYILSGFLMTTIITGKYGTSAKGIISYIANRVLRIYPMYIAVFLLYVLLALLWGNTPALDFNIPATLKGWVINASMIGMDFNYKDRLISPAWSLYVELFYYCLIPFIIIMGRRAVLLWLVMSASYHAYSVYSLGMYSSWDVRYGTILAGSIGFSIGCALKLYNFKIIENKYIFKLSFVTLTLVYGLTAASFLSKERLFSLDSMSTYFFYVNMLASAVVIKNIFNIKQNNTCLLLGDLSYPFYLTHTLSGVILMRIGIIETRSIYLFVFGVLLTCGICMLLRRFEIAIDSIRDRVRSYA